MEQVSAYEEELHRLLDTRHPEILKSIRDTKMLTPENEAALKEFLTEFTAEFQSSHS